MLQATSSIKAARGSSGQNSTSKKSTSNVANVGAKKLTKSASKKASNSGTPVGGGFSQNL